MTRSPFSARLETLMHQCRLNSEKIANAANTTEDEVKAWLAGDKEPDAAQLFRICMAYEVSADYLLAIGPDIYFIPPVFSDNITDVRPMPDGYDACLTYLNMRLDDRAEDFSEHDKEKSDANPFRNPDYDAAASLPLDIRNGVLALIKLERQIYDSAYLQELEAEDMCNEDEDDEDMDFFDYDDFDDIEDVCMSCNGLLDCEEAGEPVACKHGFKPCKKGPDEDDCFYDGDEEGGAYMQPQPPADGFLKTPPAAPEGKKPIVQVTAEKQPIPFFDKIKGKKKK